MKKTRIFLILSIISLPVLMLISLSLGSFYISPREIIDSLLGKTSGMVEAVIWKIRLPRILGGFFAGSALSIVGMGFQSILRNPLADPYILGISAGSAFGAVLAIALNQFMGFYWFSNVETMSFIFALLSIILTYSIAFRKRTLPVVELILSGAIVNLLFGSLITFTITFYWRNVSHSTFWLMGSLSGVYWDDLLKLSIVSTLGFLSFLTLANSLNALSLGEEEAVYLGVRIELVKIMVFVIGSLMTAFVVSTSGIIGFVGLVVPHMVRMVFGSDHRLTIPMSFIAGGELLVICDTISRTLFQPTEMPIGVITSFVGIPIFIYILKRRKYRM
ncbi:MAG: iron ABC transporter permease [Thermotoga sp.]|nr:MAG: iron ABC transporter permease [Thermotoga sp.]